MFDLHIDVGSSVAILNTCRCHLRSVIFNDRLLSSRARALIASPHRDCALIASTSCCRGPRALIASTSCCRGPRALEICVMPKRKRSALPKPRAGRRRRRSLGQDDDDDGACAQARGGIPHLPVAVQPLTAEDLTFLCCLVGVGAPHFVVWLWCPCGARAGSRQMTTTQHINKHATKMS